MRKFAKVLAVVAMMASGAASMGCFWWMTDEPTAPKGFVD